jgi:hypothetical protein
MRFPWGNASTVFHVIGTRCRAKSYLYDAGTARGHVTPTWSSHLWSQGPDPERAAVHSTAIAWANPLRN